MKNKNHHLSAILIKLLFGFMVLHSTSCNKESYTKYEKVPELIDTVSIVEPNFTYRTVDYTQQNDDGGLWKVSGSAYRMGLYPIVDSNNTNAGSYLMCEYIGKANLTDEGTYIHVSHTYNRINNGDNACVGSPYSGYAKRYFDPLYIDSSLTKIELNIDSLRYLQSNGGYGEIRLRWNRRKIVLKDFKVSGWSAAYSLNLLIEFDENQQKNWTILPNSNPAIATCEIDYLETSENSIEFYSFLNREKKGQINNSRFLISSVSLKVWE